MGALGCSWEILGSSLGVARGALGWPNARCGAKARKMKAVEETHEESEDRLAFEQNHGQRSISDERLDLLFGRFLSLIQYRKCKT